MRATNGFLAAALVVGFSTAALAQGPPPPVATPPLAPADDAGLARSHWLVSGSVGSNFGSTDSDINASRRRSVGVGAQAGYLWRGVVGGEFLANFTPSFGANGTNATNNPHVNGYMANVIGAYPLGAKGQYQPYLSGGYGGIQARVANIGATDISSNELTGGANIGTGLMAFVGRSKFGVRADARYYHAFVNSTPDASTIAGEVTQTLLSGLNFWQTNVGLAYQW